MEARVFIELRRPLGALPLFQDVLTRYDATHAREVALYRSWLAVALADANEPEQAAEEARRVIDMSGDLSSERAAERVRTVLQRLKENEDVPEARELIADYGHLLLAQGYAEWSACRCAKRSCTQCSPLGRHAACFPPGRANEAPSVEVSRKEKID